MLLDLCIKPKKIEFLCFRRSVIVILLLALILSFTVLTMKLVSEKPNISLDFQPEAEIPMPRFYIFHNGPLEINCTIYYLDGRNSSCRIDDIEMNKSVDNFYMPQYFEFMGSYTPKGLNFTKEGNSMRYISLDLIAPKDVNAYMETAIFDAEFDPYTNETKDAFSESFYYMNSYDIDLDSYSLIGFSRKFRNTFNKTVWDYIGFPVKHETVMYINSRIQSASLGNSSLFGTVDIFPQSFILEGIIEQRNDSIINVLGTVFGYYGFIVTIYIFLFGPNPIRPFGFVYNVRGTKKDILGKYIDTDTDTRKDAKGIDVLEKLDKRVKKLENIKHFLADYVVDIEIKQEEN